MDRKKVLVVDDLELNRNMIKTFLYFAKFDADLAEDGLQGLEFLKKNKYDLIFSDLEMPNMNGLEFLTNIRKNPETKNIPVIMLTSVDNPEIIERAISLGASDYMIKPFTKDKVETSLKKLGFN